MHWAKFNARGWELKHTPKDATKTGLQTCIFIGNLVFFLLNIFHFHLNLLDPRVIVVDRCLKVHGPSDRRGKLLACWPSHAVTILTSFVPQESHIGHMGVFGIFWVPSATPKKSKVGPFAER